MGVAMTNEQADRIIAEKVMGWHVEVGGYCVVRRFHPSTDYNQLREAEMRLSEKQRVEYGWRLAEKLDLMPANDCISVPIDVLDLFKILTAHAEVRAVAMAEMMEGK